MDDGYVNTGSTISAITFLDGEQGILRYRGYPIEQLAERSDFVETSYLLIYGELPTKSQLDYFSTSLRAAHDAARGNEIVLRRLPARCPSDGDLCPAWSGRFRRFIRIRSIRAIRGRSKFRSIG